MIYKIPASFKKATSITLLILAGETIFFLPFVLARVFRPTLLAVFEINNTQLGSFFSIYGVIAMAAYFFGGPLADRFPAKNLIAIALITTGIGGLLMAQIPNTTLMYLLYGFWGLTTILLFWAALIKATRAWGGHQIQGRAFGLLDGGRGLAAALMGSITVFVFEKTLPNGIELANEIEKQVAFKSVILIVSYFTIFIGIMTYYVLQKERNKTPPNSSFITLKTILEIIKKPIVWLQAIIIICAYVGYKITDDFSLMAKEVMNFNEIKSAHIGTLALWMRPIVAITAGILADKIQSSKAILGGFVLMAIGGLLMANNLIEISSHQSIFFGTIIITSTGVFTLRALYFTLLEESKIPIKITGTTIGIISVLGYTPDIFMGPIMGVLLDQKNKSLAHQQVFMFMIGFAVVGYFTTLLFKHWNKPSL